MSKMKTLLSSMIKIGLIGFGGGNALVPVIEQEVVKNNQLVTKEEYDLSVIVGNITPGALTIKVAGGVGRTVAGIKGMLLAAGAMSLPGVLIMLALLAGISSADAEVIRQIEIVSVGITAYILYMLTKYIQDTFTWAKPEGRSHVAAIIMMLVFVLSVGKNIVKILAVFGIEATSYFSIPTLQILMMTFFVVCYVGSRLKKRRVVIASIICVIYSLFISKADIIGMVIQDASLKNVLLKILQLLMTAMAIWGIATGKNRKAPISHFPLKQLIKEELLLLVLLVFFSIPACMVVPSVVEYIGEGLVSCIVSFGGGDAYLTVADGFFVAGGMISESDFYGRLVTIVNILPGSVLGKMLPGVGYYIGYEHGGIGIGILVAFAGFACSIVGSCVVILVVQNFLQTFEQLKAFRVLKNWIKAVISGLLGVVMLSLVYQCIKVASTFGANVILVLVEVLSIYLLNFVLEKKFHCDTWICVIISCVISLGIGNIIM